MISLAMKNTSLANRLLIFLPILPRKKTKNNLPILFLEMKITLLIGKIRSVLRIYWKIQQLMINQSNKQQTIMSIMAWCNSITVPIIITRPIPNNTTRQTRCTINLNLIFLCIINSHTNPSNSTLSRFNTIMKVSRILPWNDVIIIYEYWIL